MRIQEMYVMTELAGLGLQTWEALRMPKDCWTEPTRITTGEGYSALGYKTPYEFAHGMEARL